MDGGTGNGTAAINKMLHGSITPQERIVPVLSLEPVKIFNPLPVVTTPEWKSAWELEPVRDSQTALKYSRWATLVDLERTKNFPFIRGVWAPLSKEEGRLHDEAVRNSEGCAKRAVQMAEFGIGFVAIIFALKLAMDNGWSGDKLGVLAAGITMMSIGIGLSWIKDTDF